MPTYEETREIKMNTRRERYTTILNKVSEIAGMLGNGWTVKQDDAISIGVHLASRIKLLNTSTGHGIVFAWVLYQKTGKLNIFGVYNYGPSEFHITFPRDFDKAEINVAETKTAKQIFADMQRRLIPQALAAGEWITQKITEYAECKVSFQDRCARLASVAGGAMHNRFTDRGFLANYPHNGVRVDVEIYGETIKLDVGNLNETQAHSLLATIRAWNASIEA